MNFLKSYRLPELLVLLYRIGLVYFFYFLARVGFVIYNNDLLEISSITSFFQISYYGLAFDTAAMLYCNGLFLLLSILPLSLVTKPVFQKVLFYVYFTTNLLAFAMNFIDFAYYRFSQSRTTSSTTDVLANEQNKMDLFLHFLGAYWHVFLLFIFCAMLWVFLYKKVTIGYSPILSKKRFAVASVLLFLGVPVLAVGGIRGDFKHSTRPINLVDASRHVKVPVHADAVLNTPFAFIRTINKNAFKTVDFVSDRYIKNTLRPIKQYAVDTTVIHQKPNVVVFIIESFGREYIGAFNKALQKTNPDYKSYTPFLDSLAQKSLIFPNGFANGRQSIHGMSSVLSGIPSFEVAFTSSSYANQPITSMVSGLNELGYDTSFFHGAPNGSMGFLGFSTILGFDHYYGKTEYANDKDHDGIWGIWDEPFLQYMNKELSKKTTPFMATVFTLSSHDPFKVPQQYTNTFAKGHIPMHQCVGYTDYALSQFFKHAKKQPWFANTIFVLTADHTNQIHEKTYKKALNRFAVPILFYSPKKGFLEGVDTSLAQQIDIFPTVLDIVNYPKPFRSWGRSLTAKKPEEVPYIINHTGRLYQVLLGDYICVFDGKKAIGFYDKEDLGLSNNLIGNKTPKMQESEKLCKAFIQDYMQRITQRALGRNTY